MSLNINQARQSGFTIVELLIVVVVIAILAAITIVSYNGITTQANAAAAKSFTSTVAKKFEAYQAENGRYPVVITEVNSSADASRSYYINLAAAAGTTASTYSTQAAVFETGTSSLNANVGKNVVSVRKCASGTPANQAAITASNVTGLELRSWDYNTAAVSTTVTYLGANTGSTTTCPAS